MMKLLIFYKGETIKNKITIIEGWTNKDIAEYLEKINLFEKNKILDLINSNSFNFDFLKNNTGTLEGYLFPDTYLLEKNETEEGRN